jgi:hypothetical protein
VGIRRADHATLLNSQKLALNFANKWRRSVGIVRLRTKGHGVCFVCALTLICASTSRLLTEFRIRCPLNAASETSQYVKFHTFCYIFIYIVFQKQTLRSWRFSNVPPPPPKWRILSVCTWARTCFGSQLGPSAGTPASVAWLNLQCVCVACGPCCRGNSGAIGICFVSATADRLE